MKDIQDILGEVGGQLSGIANGEAVVGSPIQVGGATIYPISRISVGMGAGGGTGDDPHPRTAKGPASGTGGGAGGGAKARPIAVLVFAEGGGVSVLPIAEKAGKLDQLFEKIPGLVERLKGACA